MIAMYMDNGYYDNVELFTCCCHGDRIQETKLTVLLNVNKVYTHTHTHTLHVFLKEKDELYIYIAYRIVIEIDRAIQIKVSLKITSWLSLLDV